MKAPAAEAVSSDDQALELMALREQVAEPRKMIDELAERQGRPLPGNPRSDSPLDHEKAVQEVIHGMQLANERDLAELANGPKKYEVVMVIGDKEMKPTRRTVGAHSEGDAQHKYIKCCKIIRLGDPTSLKVTELPVQAA
jgi:hypothetical protein